MIKGPEKRRGASTTSVPFRTRVATAATVRSLPLTVTQ
jgi:hypothetical protein